MGTSRLFIIAFIFEWRIIMESKNNSIGLKVKIKTKRGKYIEGILKSVIKRHDGKDLMLVEEWHLINNDMIAEMK